MRMSEMQLKCLESTKDLAQEICKALQSPALREYCFDHYRHTPDKKQERTFQHAVLRELYQSGCTDVFSEVRYRRTGFEKNPPSADLALVKRLPDGAPNSSKTLTHPSSEGDRERIFSQVEIKYHYLSDLIPRYRSVKEELFSDMKRDPDIFIHVIADRLGISNDFRFQDLLSVQFSEHDSDTEKRQEAFENLGKIYCGGEGVNISKKDAAGKKYTEYEEIKWNAAFKHVYAKSICIVSKSNYLPPFAVPPLKLLCAVFVKGANNLGKEFKPMIEWAQGLKKDRIWTPTE